MLEVTKRAYHARMMPSGPELHARHFSQDTHDPRFVGNPWALYRRLHDIGGPLWWEEYRLWCLFGFDAVNQALRDRRLRRLPPPDVAPPEPAPHLQEFAVVERHSLLALEPPEHTRLRKRVNHAFVSRQIRNMAAGIEALSHQCVDQLIRASPDGRTTELLAHYATPIPVTVIARLIGVPDTECADLLRWSHAMVKVYTMTQTRNDEMAANQAACEFRRRLCELIKIKRKAPADDLVSHLLSTGTHEDPLCDEEIVSILILLLNAGHEATVHQLGNAVRTLLLRGPDAEPVSDLFATEARSQATVSELLRHDAPLHLFTRYAQEDIDLGAGVVLPRGEQLALLLGAANRDPSRFREPDRFDPDRGDAGHVTLGGGIHFCIGAQLAKLEIGIALRVLFERLPTLSLDGSPVFRDSFHFHALERLSVRW